MKFLINVLFLLLLFPSLINAKNSFYIDRIDIDSYPSISIFLKNKIGTKLEKENILIQESYENHLRYSKILSIEEEKSSKKSNILFLIEADKDEKNYLLEEFIKNISYDIDQNDTMDIIYLLDGDFASSKKIDYKDENFKLNIPVVSTKENLIFSLEKSFQEIGNSIDKNTFIVLILFNENDMKFTSDLIYFLDRIRNQIHLYSNFSSFSQEFIQYSGGNFYNFDQHSYQDILLEYKHFKNKEIKVTYNSNIGEFLNFTQENKINLSMEYKKDRLKYQYSISGLAIVKNILLEPYVFYGIMIFLFILVLYARIKMSNHLKKVNEIKTYKDTDTSIEKDEIKTIEPEEIYSPPVQSKIDSYEIKQYSLIESGQLEKAQIYTKAYLVKQELNSQPTHYQLPKEEIFIGKSRSNDIILDDPSVYDYQSKIKKIQNHYVLFDMASGETFLNQKKVLKPELLKDFDEINLGKNLFIFRAD